MNDDKEDEVQRQIRVAWVAAQQRQAEWMVPYNTILSEPYYSTVSRWPKNYFVLVVNAFDIDEGFKQVFRTTGTFQLDVTSDSVWNGRRDRILQDLAARSYRFARTWHEYWTVCRWPSYGPGTGPNGRGRFKEGLLPSLNPIQARDALDHMQICEETPRDSEAHKACWMAGFMERFGLMENVFGLWQTWTPMMRDYMSATTPMFSIHDDAKKRLHDIRWRSSVVHLTKDYWRFVATRPESINQQRPRLHYNPRRDPLKLAFDRSDIDRLARRLCINGMPWYGMDSQGNVGGLMLPGPNHAPGNYDRYCLPMDDSGVVFDAFKLNSFFDGDVVWLPEAGRHWVAHRMDFHHLRHSDIHRKIKAKIESIDGARILQREGVVFNDVHRERIRRLYITKFVDCVEKITRSFDGMRNFQDASQSIWRYDDSEDLSIEATGVPDINEQQFVPSGDNPSYIVSQEVRTLLESGDSGKSVLEHHFLDYVGPDV